MREFATVADDSPERYRQQALLPTFTGFIPITCMPNIRKSWTSTGGRPGDCYLKGMSWTPKDAENSRPLKRSSRRLEHLCVHDSGVDMRRAYRGRFILPKWYRQRSLDREGSASAAMRCDVGISNRVSRSAVARSCRSLRCRGWSLETRAAARIRSRVASVSTLKSMSG